MGKAHLRSFGGRRESRSDLLGRRCLRWASPHLRSPTSRPMHRPSPVTPESRTPHSVSKNCPPPQVVAQYKLSGRVEAPNPETVRLSAVSYLRERWEDDEADLLHRSKLELSRSAQRYINTTVVGLRFTLRCAARDLPLLETHEMDIPLPSGRHLRRPARRVPGSRSGSALRPTNHFSNRSLGLDRLAQVIRMRIGRRSPVS